MLITSQLATRGKLGATYFVDAHEICQSVDDELVAWAVGVMALER